MYVTDADNDAAPIEAQTISTDRLGGAVILGKALIFNKARESLTDAAFDLVTEGETECYVMGVSSGRWTVERPHGQTTHVTVADGEGIISFTASAGQIKLSLMR